ncbi:MAG: hypothetical protein ACK5IB_02050 [Qingshengfaniella sp.]
MGRYQTIIAAAPIAAFLAGCQMQGTTSAKATPPGTLPAFSAICPGDMQVRSAAGGPVFINGTEAVMTKFNDFFYEAKRPGLSVSVSIDTAGRPHVAYIVPGAHGACRMT